MLSNGSKSTRQTATTTTRGNLISRNDVNLQPDAVMPYGQIMASGPSMMLEKNLCSCCGETSSESSILRLSDQSGEVSSSSSIMCDQSDLECTRSSATNTISGLQPSRKKRGNRKIMVPK
ncbi:hypothetical protein RRG08_014403 [Elysia crispata]|uniref:Uncharacterized protein n=1 Tax=Elysia crispata TaxID=231223 RepID=A0AAE1D5A4_9GAST|nr:hypothetical protein RRG08_014403 [Elysia crispata]